MPSPPIDYPHCRDNATCPLCGRDKDIGLLVCWPCYRAHNLRNGTADLVKTILDDYEAKLTLYGNA